MKRLLTILAVLFLTAGCNKLLPELTVSESTEPVRETATVEEDTDNECFNVECKSPPRNRCLNAVTIIIYEARGVCDEGKCQYDNEPKTCPGGCEGGKCTGDPCFGVSCLNAPEPSCLDDSTLVRHATEGGCVEGECEYEAQSVPCVNGCEDDHCIDDMCAGIICDNPPASYCQENERISHQKQGQCDSADGTCVYEPFRETCAWGCELGQCKDKPIVTDPVGTVETVPRPTSSSIEPTTDIGPTEWPSDSSDCDTGNNWYLDNDGDGVGAGDPVVVCERPSGSHVLKGGDCNDQNGEVFPGQDKTFEEPFKTNSGTESFDYNCDGEETEDSMFNYEKAPPQGGVCPNIDEDIMCFGEGEGYLEAPERRGADNPYCGSNQWLQCSVSADLTACIEEETDAARPIKCH